VARRAATRELKMQRLIITLALAVTAITLSWGSVTRAQVAAAFLSGGADGLPATSQLVSARLGIDGALSLRHLCLWTFLLSSGLLPLSGCLPVSASVNSCRTAGPSPAVSASRVVVVKSRR
jgi:hypothetical protein